MNAYLTLLVRKNLALAVKVFHKKVEQQLITVLDSDFFAQATEPAVKTCYVDLSCFKTLIKGLCKTGLEHDFKEVHLLL